MPNTCERIIATHSPKVYHRTVDTHNPEVYHMTVDTHSPEVYHRTLDTRSPEVFRMAVDKSKIRSHVCEGPKPNPPNGSWGHLGPRTFVRFQSQGLHTVVSPVREHRVGANKTNQQATRFGSISNNAYTA